MFTILSASKKVPVSKFRYFEKYIIQLDGYLHVHVSGQRWTGLDINKQIHEPWNYGAHDARAVCGYRSF